MLSCVTETDGVCKTVIRMRAGGLEDVQHAGTGDVPHLRTELVPVQDHQVLQTVRARPRQLLIICQQRRSYKHAIQ